MQIYSQNDKNDLKHLCNCDMYFHMRFQIILNYICEPLKELDQFCITNEGFKRLLTITLW